MRITSKGQVTIPTAIRERAGLMPNTEVEFVVEGARHSPLPDFYIGAHAALKGYRLLTRDPKRYWTYRPRPDVISPETD